MNSNHKHTLGYCSKGREFDTSLRYHRTHAHTKVPLNSERMNVALKHAKKSTSSPISLLGLHSCCLVPCACSQTQSKVPMDSKRRRNNWLQHIKTKCSFLKKFATMFTCPLFGDRPRRRGIGCGQQFVLSHIFKHYTCSIISCNTTKLCNITCTLVATCAIIQSVYKA